jgi:hypothetical protein
VPVPNLYLSQIVSLLRQPLSFLYMGFKLPQLSLRLRTRNQNCEFFLCMLALFVGSFWLAGCAGYAEKTPSTAPQIIVTPNSITFQNVIVGQKNTQTIQIGNTGNANLNVSAITLTGAGFSLSSITAPFALAPGANKNFSISFAPTSATTPAKGTISIASDDSTPVVSVAVEGTAVKANLSWQMAPTSITFPSLTVQTSQTQNASIKNNGNVPVTISSVNLSGAAFSTSGLSSGTTLSPQQQANFQITFHPTAAGTAKGTLSVSSSSVSSLLTMSLSGAGLTASNPPPPPSAPAHHTVTLTWNASTSTVAGYNIYRGSISGGPYSMLNSSLTVGTTYTDTAVASGSEYFYVTTAVNASGEESTFSNEASAAIPNP